VHIITLTVYQNFTNISNNNIKLCKITRSNARGIHLVSI
jgi:hypothetical protein